ncbi:MAG: hypothetical protein JXD23_06530 [Spirochaetales bacterium]|nr:hypothetical protein [Spirochaetales bacterium]
MGFNRRKNPKRTAIIRALFRALAVALLAFSLSCQTPPKKANRTTSSGHTSQARGGGIDLFSASAEPFGTDPRASRPALVSGTVFAVAGGAAVLLSGAVMVSAARAGRARAPRRSRPRRAA